MIMDGKELKGLRKRLGYSLREFAEKIGLSKDMLNRYEKGVKKIPEEEMVRIKKRMRMIVDNEKLDLQVKVDYLKLTFFDVSAKRLVEQVLGIDEKYFKREKSKQNNYDTRYTCGSIVVMTEEDGNKEEKRQGTLLELTSVGITEFEEVLEERGETLERWLREIFEPEHYIQNGIYSKVHSTRIDLAIDEMWNEGGTNFDIELIDKKYKQGLVNTTLKKYTRIEGQKNGKSTGTTINFGGRGQDGLCIRMYEKRLEQAVKNNIDEREELERSGIYNRFELECGKRVNAGIFKRWLNGEDLLEIAIGLLLTNIEVYDENEKGELTGCEEWYGLFGDWKTIKTTQTNSQTNLEKTMSWIEKGVGQSLRYIAESIGKQATLEWLSNCIDEAKLSPRREKQLLKEKVMVEEARKRRIREMTNGESGTGELSPVIGEFVLRQEEIEFEEIMYDEPYVIG